MKRLLFIFLVSICLNSYTQTIYIPVDYSTIQEGIDYANDYDTIIVYPGTYKENLVIQNKKLVLMSFSSLRNDTGFIYLTIIDGMRKSSCIRVVNSEILIDGFSVTNGFMGLQSHGYDWNIAGGGIYCENSTLTINNVIIRNNMAFRPNSTGHGGGVYMKSSSVKINYTIIKNNTSMGGCGIYSIDSELSMSKCLLTNNINPISVGDGCYLTNSYISFRNITITDNGFPILIKNGSYGEIINSIIWEEHNSWEDYPSINIEYSDLKFISGQISNINLDPLLDTSYFLTANSPCIDSGSPDYKDPDGTRSDMGAFYFSQNPVPDFNFTKKICETPFLIKFNNTTKQNDKGDSLNSFHWNFGDGTSSVEKEPQHIYSNPDKFDVKLTVTDVNDSTVSIQKIVDLTYPQIITGDTTLDVLDTIMICVPGGVPSYSWSTGSENRNAIVSARSLGTGEHKIFVEITDEFDCIYKDSISLTIKNDSNIQLGPRAYFDYQQLTYEDSLFVIMFTDKSMMNNFNDEITEWSWDFGDETFSTERDPIHRYYEDKVYTVVLQVTDINDSTNIIQKSVEIIDVSNNPIPEQFDKKLTIFPNPNKGGFKIHLDNHEFNYFTLDIFNIDGQLVYKNSYSSDAYITLTDFEPGLYFIRIISDGKQYQTKLVIE